MEEKKTMISDKVEFENEDALDALKKRYDTLEKNFNLLANKYQELEIIKDSLLLQIRLLKK